MNIRQKKAIQAVVELALCQEREMRSAGLAERLSLTKDAVHQLMLVLVRQGLVEAGRGRHGGYRLPASAHSRSVWSVVAPFSADGLVREEAPEVPEYIKHLDDRAREAFRQVFETETVAGLAEKARNARRVLDYAI